MDELSAAEIQRRMVAVRASLAADARGAVAKVQATTDWRHHFREHPWLWCGGAVAVGWLVAPRRLVASPQLTQAVPAISAPPLKEEAGMAKVMVGMLASVAARQAVTIASGMARDLLAEYLANRRSASAEDSPIPDEVRP